MNSTRTIAFTIAIAASLGAAPAADADVVNLRDWLAGNGIDVAGCVSGEGHHSSYGPAVLFDGVTDPANATEAAANRWLANEAKGTFSGYATIAAPDTLFATPDAGLVLSRYRVWRYSSLSSDNCHLHRAPATWVLYGSNDGSNWDIVDEHDTAELWNGEPAYIEVEIPEAARASYRRFKFLPTASRAFLTDPNGIGYTWQIGAMELQLFVEPTTVASRFSNLTEVIRGAEVDVPSCVTSGNTHSSFPATKLFDGEGMGVENTSLRWLAAESSFDGAHATIGIPNEATDGGRTDFILKGYRMWRNVNGQTGIDRAPATWTVYGSNDGVNWTEIHSQSTPVSWGAAEYSKAFAMPSNAVPWRFIRFVPQSSNSTYTWKTGLQELEYFVERTEPLVNIRDLFSTAGVSASAYVSGAGAHPNFPVERLFDGLGTNGVKNANYRWLAGETSLDGVFATLRIPSRVLPDGVGGYAVRKIRLWRNVLEGNDEGMCILRGPTTWIVEGSDNGTDWSTIQSQTSAVDWETSGLLYLDFHVAGNETPFKYLRFRPLTSRCTNPSYTWRVGLNELEYFGVPIPGGPTPFVLVVR